MGRDLMMTPTPRRGVGGPGRTENPNGPPGERDPPKKARRAGTVEPAREGPPGKASQRWMDGGMGIRISPKV